MGRDRGSKLINVALQSQHDVLVLARSVRFERWREAVYAFMNATTSERRCLRTIRVESRRLRRWMRRQSSGSILVSDENLFGARLYKADDGSTLHDWARRVLPLIEAQWSP